MEVLVSMILDQVDMVVAAMMMVHRVVIVVDRLHLMNMFPVTMVLQEVTVDRLAIMVIPQEATMALQEALVAL